MKDEFVRFVSSANTTPPAAPDVCEASQSNRELVGTLQSVEQQLAEARAQVAALRKQKGWSDKEAAAAGEAVLLNGTGYNYRTAGP